jgi:hypothetical protein
MCLTVQADYQIPISLNPCCHSKQLTPSIVFEILSRDKSTGTEFFISEEYFTSDFT